jgi:hypothetical protein
LAWVILAERASPIYAINSKRDVHDSDGGSSTQVECRSALILINPIFSLPIIELNHLFRVIHKFDHRKWG